MIHLGTVSLLTPRLVLRQYTLDDVDAAYANWMSDPEVARYVTWEAHPDRDVTREVLSVWIGQYANEHYYHWGIEMDGVLIGDIAVVMGSEQHEHAEIGYCLSRKYWGQGVMSEALGRVLRFMFKRMRVHRIMTRHDVQNPGSGSVMRKNGMTKEGTMREHFRRKDGTWADLDVYSILDREWMALHGKELDDGDVS